MYNRVDHIDTVADATAANQVVTFDDRTENIAAIALYYTGVNKDGKEASLADCLTGHTRIKDNDFGDILSTIRAQYFLTWWEAFKGWYYEISVAGDGADDGVYEGVLIIPFHLPYDSNALLVQSALEIQIPQFDPSATFVTEATCEVAALINDAAYMRYVPRMFEKTKALGGVASRNIAENTGVMIIQSAETTEPSRISIMSGTNRRWYTSRNAAYAIYQTIMEMESEPTMTGDIVMDFTDNGRNIFNLIGNGNKLEALDGDGDLSFLTYALDMHHPDMMRKSRKLARSYFGQSRERARIAGIPETSVREAVALPAFTPAVTRSGAPISSGEVGVARRAGSSRRAAQLTNRAF